MPPPLFFSIILDVNWPVHKNSFIQSLHNHLLSSYYSLGFAVVLGYTKDTKINEFPAIMEPYILVEETTLDNVRWYKER